MAVTVRQVAEWIDGVVIGDGATVIRAARPVNDAGPEDVTFVDSERYVKLWDASAAAAAIVGESMPSTGRPIIRVADPLLAFAQVVLQFRGATADVAPHIDASARIHPTATLEAGVSVGPFAVIGEGVRIAEGTRVHAGVKIGRNCRLGRDGVLYPNVVLYDDCILGDRVVIHANSVIGADGFGYRTAGGRHVKVPQLSHVEIGDDVEVGACSTIDRGTFSPTTIGEGTKLDNHVQIAHNCSIGKHNLLVCQVGIAGSCKTGDHVVLAGQVGIGDHTVIGDNAKVGAQSGVHRDIPADSRMLGTPARPAREMMKVYFATGRLPELREDVARIKKHLGLSEGQE